MEVCLLSVFIGVLTLLLTIGWEGLGSRQGFALASRRGTNERNALEASSEQLPNGDESQPARAKGQLVVNNFKNGTNLVLSDRSVSGVEAARTFPQNNGERNVSKNKEQLEGVNSEARPKTTSPQNDKDGVQPTENKGKLRNTEEVAVQRLKATRHPSTHEGRRGRTGRGTGLPKKTSQQDSDRQTTTSRDRASRSSADKASNRDRGVTQYMSYVGNPSFHDLNKPHCLLENGDVEVSNESRLIGFLLGKLHRVGTLARPVTDSSKPVQVGFRMTFVQLLDFDETKQLLITNVWKEYQWKDETLLWNPSEFGGIQDLRLPPDIVWTPDIVLYNNADEQYEREQHHELVAIFFNGTVKWIPSAIYKSSCEVDMTNFPFDVQTCFFKFGSWTYDGLKLNLQFLSGDSNIDMDEYVKSAEWDILDHRGWRRTRQYPCCGDDPYPELTYTITLKRKTAFYVVVLVLPCLLLSCLTLVIFWFPPQRPDRTGLGMSLFSSFFVLLLILVQASPPTAQSISLLGLYYCINMTLIALSTMVSAIVINLLEHKTGRVQVPRVLMKFHRATCWRLFFRVQGMMVQTKYTKDGHIMKQPTSNGVIKLDDRGRATIEWRALATGLDRICFLVYIVCFLLAIVLVFPR